MKVIIDGKEIEVEGKKTVLEVARENGIDIPSLCDHPRLEPFTGCRLCLVEVKERKGYPPACGTYIEDGMEVRTTSPQLQKLRREILELMLSEHPNACLICSEKKNCDEYKSTIRKVAETTGCVLCPNNGHCELQNVVEALKIDKIRFPSVYRNFEIKKGDPFFDRNYNLCILCGRCVRICHEVRGASAVSFVYRGSQAVVGTVLDKPLLEAGCQFCGACVDVCPTGSLSERALKYEGVPEAKTKTICPLCSMGCELEIELKDGRIVSSKPSAEGAVNRGQACLKGRFLVRDVVYSPRRILKPLIRKNKELEEVSWEEALNFVAAGLKKYKGKETALVASAQAATEEVFLFRKFARDVLKTENCDSSFRFSPLSTYWSLAQANGFEPNLDFKLEDIGQTKTIVLVGADLPVSHPILWLEVLKAVRGGSRLIVISPAELFLNRFSSIWLRAKPGAELYVFSYLSKILPKDGEALSRIQGFDSFSDSLQELDLSQILKRTSLREEELKKAASLLEEGSAGFLFGMGLTQHPWGSQNIAALWNLALQTTSRLYPLGLENNLRGMFEIEKAFSGSGLTFSQIVQGASSGEVKALYLAGAFPEIRKSKPDFLVIQDSFANENLNKADAVFPAATFAESEGTFINFEGRIQKFEKVISPKGEAKPDWWIISQLASKMGNKNFSYRSSKEILEEMSKAIPAFSDFASIRSEKGKEAIVQGTNKQTRSFVPLKFEGSGYKLSKSYPFLLVVDYTLDHYKSLSLCEESKGLRAIRDSRWIKISAEDAAAFELQDREEIVVKSESGKIKGIARITESIPKGIVSASFLWNAGSDFSVTSLLFSLSSVRNSLGAIPVRIERGK